MRLFLVLALVLPLSPSWAVAAGPKKVDLRTKAGVEAVKGEWRYSDVKVVEVPTKTTDGKPTTTYNIEPKSFGPKFDDKAWDVVDPTTLGKPAGRRSGLLRLVSDQNHDPGGGRGQERLLPDGRRRLRRGLGRWQAPVQAGRYRRPHRGRVQHAEPGRAEGREAGKVYQIAIFGINGPISVAPGNRIFLGPTFLEIVDKPT